MAVFTNRVFDSVAAAFVRWNTGSPDTGGASYPGPDAFGSTSDFVVETVSSTAGVTDHGALLGLGDDDHTQYALLAGRAGGQTLFGSQTTGQTLTLRSNSVQAPGSTNLVIDDGLDMSGFGIENVGTITAVAATFSQDVEIENNLSVEVMSGGEEAASFTATDGDEQFVLGLTTLTSTSGTNPGATELFVGNRTPEGNVAASEGALYVRTGDANSTLYIKQAGGNTGWLDLALGSAGNPAGIDKQVQYNDSSAFGADANFTWDSGAQALSIVGSVSSTRLNVTNTITSSALVAVTGTGDSTVILSLDTTNGAAPNGSSTGVFVGTRDPNGLVSGSAGTLYIRADSGTPANSTLYINVDGVNTWQDFKSPAGSVSSVTSSSPTILVASPTSGAVLLVAQNQEIDTADSNTFYGESTGNVGTHSGASNAGFGSSCLLSLTTGDGNVAIGDASLATLTTGAGNIAIGNAVGASLVGGIDNVLVGGAAGVALTSGGQNVALGSLTLGGNHSRSVAIGNQVGLVWSGTTSSDTVAVGANAASVGVRAGFSVILGANAGQNLNIDGSVAVGFESMLANTTGIENIGLGYRTWKNRATGDRNIALGYEAGEGDGITAPTGDDNIVIGSDSGRNLTTGADNTVVGSNAGSSLTTGGTNTFLGKQAGQTVTTGSGNTLIGNAITAGPGGITISNELSIGDVLFGHITEKTLRIGGTGGTVSQTEKLRIHTGLSAIEALKLVTTGSGAGARGLNIDFDATNAAATALSIDMDAAAAGAALVITHNNTTGALLVLNNTFGQMSQVLADGTVSLTSNNNKDILLGSVGSGVTLVKSAGGIIAITSTSINPVVELQGRLLATSRYPLLNAIEVDDTATFSCGIVASYEPTTTNDTVNGAYVAGVASTSNPQVTTTGAATFSANDLILIIGSENPGLYEVESHAANTLVIRGVGTSAATEDFVQTQFTAQPGASIAIVKVNVSVIRCNDSGIWETGRGSTSGITFLSIDHTMQAAYNGGGTIALDVDGGNDLAWDSATPDPVGFGLFNIVRDQGGGEVTILKAPAQLDDDANPGTALLLITGGGSNQVTAGTGNPGTDAGGMIIGGVGDAQPGGVGSAASGAGQAGADGGGGGNFLVELSNGGAGGAGSGADPAGDGGISSEFSLVASAGGPGGAAGTTGAAGIGGEGQAFRYEGSSGGPGGDGTAAGVAGAGGDCQPALIMGGKGGDAGADGGGGGADGGDGQALSVLSGDAGAASGSGTDGVVGDLIIDVGASVSELPQGLVLIGAANALAIESGNGGTLWTHAGDFSFDFAETAPVITQVAVVDVVGKTLTIRAQDNNSATNKAGDLVLEPGANAGAGLDGDLLLGLGTAQIEIDGVMLGFFENAPVVQPTVTGARNTPAALASYLTALDDLGLVVDSSTLQTAAGVDTQVAAVLEFDCAVNLTRTTELSEAVTTVTVLPPPNVGDPVVLIIKQPAGANYAVSGWPANFKFGGGGGEPTITATNAAVDRITAYWDGTDFLATWEGNFV